MKTILMVALTLCLSLTGRANSAAKAALIHEIVQVHGVDEMLRDAKKAASAQAKDVVKQMFDQVRAGVPSLSKKSFDAIQAAADKMMRTIEGSWDIEEALRIWEADYATDFTEAELSAVLDACKSPIGKKQIVAGRRAGSALQKYILESGKVKMDAAVAEYVADLQKIVASEAAAEKPGQTEAGDASK